MAIEHTRQHALVPLVAAILIAVLAVGVSRPVLADHLVTFGSSTCGDPPGQTPRNCLSGGDDSTHSVYRISVGTGSTAAIRIGLGGVASYRSRSSGERFST